MELLYWLTVIIGMFLVIRIIIYALTQFAKGLAEVIEVDVYCNNVVYPCSYWSEKGGRPYQEDRFEMSGGREGFEETSVYAVFDGHGGDKAAQYCKDHLLQNILQHKTFGTDTVMAMRSAFAQTDAAFSELARDNSMTDGTTAVVAAVLDRKVTVANAGDSRCILVKKGGNAVALSEDHKPSRDDEVARIRKLGGEVIYWGRWRVQGVLAVSRAIGDVNLKPYVTSEPEVHEWDMEGDDCFLVIASDGLWDVMTNEDVGRFVSRGKEFKDLARALCHEAMLLGSADNVTALVIDIKSSSSMQQQNSQSSLASSVGSRGSDDKAALRGQ